MSSFVIKLNEVEVCDLIEMIDRVNNESDKGEIIDLEELASLADNLLQQNIKCLEYLKKIEL